ILVPAWGLYRGFDAVQWLWVLVFLNLNGMSITGGYHRLWAHKTYEAGALLKWLFAFWGAGAPSHKAGDPDPIPSRTAQETMHFWHFSPMARATTTFTIASRSTTAMVSAGGSGIPPSG